MSCSSTSEKGVLLYIHSIDHHQHQNNHAVQIYHNEQRNGLSSSPAIHHDRTKTRNHKHDQKQQDQASLVK